MKTGIATTVAELRKMYDKPAPQPAQKIMLKGSKARKQAGESDYEAMARIISEAMASSYGPAVQKIVEVLEILAGKQEPEPKPFQAAGHHHLGWSGMFNKPQNFNGSSRIF